MKLDNIVHLHEEGESTQDKLHEFLGKLKEKKQKLILISVDEDGAATLGCTASHPAEVIVMLDRLQNFAKYMATTYSSVVFDFDEEDDDEEAND